MNLSLHVAFEFFVFPTGVFSMRNLLPARVTNITVRPGLVKGVKLAQKDVLLFSEASILKLMAHSALSEPFLMHKEYQGVNPLSPALTFFSNMGTANAQK